MGCTVPPLFSIAARPCANAAKAFSSFSFMACVRPKSVHTSTSPTPASARSASVARCRKVSSRSEASVSDPPVCRIARATMSACAGERSEYFEEADSPDHSQLVCPYIR